jgi:hypothetical protein
MLIDASMAILRLKYLSTVPSLMAPGALSEMSLHGDQASRPRMSSEFGAKNVCVCAARAGSVRGPRRALGEPLDAHICHKARQKITYETYGCGSAEYEQ